jgi:hypothetical protein
MNDNALQSNRLGVWHIQFPRNLSMRATQTKVDNMRMRLGKRASPCLECSHVAQGPSRALLHCCLNDREASFLQDLRISLSLKRKRTADSADLVCPSIQGSILEIRLLLAKETTTNALIVSKGKRTSNHMPCSPIQEFLETSLEVLVLEIREKAKQFRSGLKEGLRDLEK